MNESNELLNYFNGDELASSVWKSKYAQEGENTPNDMHKRLAKEFFKKDSRYVSEESRFKDKSNLSEYGKTREDLDENMIFNFFKDFKYIIPQGRVMAGLGVEESYRSLSNCLRLPPPKDSYSSIMFSDTMLVSAAKRGCGYGIGLSGLRPRGAKVKNSASSSTGAPSFMDRYSFSTREVAQEGRRGACLEDISIIHPDVLEFIEKKKDKTKVTGANISVKLFNEFMSAVQNEDDFVLRFPCETTENEIFGADNDIKVNAEYNILYNGETKGTHYKKIKAKLYWDKIIENAWENAEPGLFFWDRVLDYDPSSVYTKYFIDGTNACVTHDTKILTDKGIFPIIDLVGETVNVWNGEEFSEVVPKVTGEDKEITIVSLSDGRKLKCTANHKWYLWDGFSRGGNSIKKETSELIIGDKIEKYKLPVIEFGEDDKNAYSQGFYSGDGVKNSKTIWLYGEKIDLKKNLNGRTVGNSYTTLSGVIRENFILNFLPRNKEYVPTNDYSVKARLEWLAGLFDSDGTVAVEKSVQIVSTNKEFLIDVQHLLTTLGVNSKVVKADTEGFRTLPDGKGGHKEYFCKETHRILIGTSQIRDLLHLGLKTFRLKLEDVSPNRDAQRFVTVVGVELQEELEDFVYCFTEDKKHKGVFNGVLTGQCGEQPMAVYDTCRLILLNLYSFVKNPFTKEAEVDYDLLYRMSYEQMRLGDNLVDSEIEYIDRIINKINSDNLPLEEKQIELTLWDRVRDMAESGRRVGCGITALADMLASLGVKYDSSEAFDIVEKVMKTKMLGELDATIDLAQLRGTFSGWDKEIEYPLNEGANSFYKFLAEDFPKQTERMKIFGRRNNNWNTIAPAGSVSIVAKTDKFSNLSSGCEPTFMPYYMRKKKINPSDKSSRVDFIDQNGDTWQEYPVVMGAFKEWLFVNNNFENVEDFNAWLNAISKDAMEKFYKDSPWMGSTANDIDWVKRVKVQGLLQKYTTSAISSTLNLPSEVTQKEVSEIYFAGWKEGLKGITIYRDGSRTGVMTSNDSKKELVMFNENHAPKRPKKLNAKVVRFNNNYEKWVAFVGLMDNKPYEVFTGKLGSIDIPLSVEVGEIVKIKENEVKRYDFNYNGGTVEGISNVFSYDFWNYGKLISGMLRHGMPLQFVVDTIQELNWEEDHINTWKNGIARALKKFIQDGVVQGITCKDCSGSNVIFQEGCMSCKDCGSSKCG